MSSTAALKIRARVAAASAFFGRGTRPRYHRGGALRDDRRRLAALSELVAQYQRRRDRATMLAVRWLTCVLLGTCALGCSEEPAPAPPPPAAPVIASGCGHAHNDYEHARPLLDALERGFCSVEVDVFLVNGELLVAHELAQTDPARTLDTLYLDPLLVMHEAGGIDHATAGPLTLLIDIKSEASATYAAVHERLEAHAAMLTVFEPHGVTPGSVTAVISGNRDRAAMQAQGHRYAAMDGRLADLDSGAPATLIPLISQSWFDQFLWMGDGTLPEEDRARLVDFADRAHAEERRLRFWSIPDNPNSWSQLLEAGVDLINTDDLDGFAAFAGTTP
jgi:hypothetical protein